jgi:hypothetical protein
MNRALIPELQTLLEDAAQQQTAGPAGSPRPRRQRLRRGMVPGSLALLASATALAATHPWSPTLGGPHRGHPTTSTSPIPNTELRLLGVLRRPQTAADRTPAVQATLRFLVAAEQHGVRIASIRNLGTSPATPGHAIIAFSLTHEGLTDGTVPGGSNDVCVVFPVLLASHTSTITDAHGQPRVATTYGGPAAGQSCGNAQQLLQGTIGEAAHVGRGAYRFGLVPDGVHTVQIHAGTGHTTSVAVHDNFFDALLNTGPNAPLGVTFTWLDADGQRVGPADR